MNRRFTVAVCGIAIATVGAAPALAKPKPKPKPIKGTFSYTDTTPDPTVTTGAADHHCHGKLPASPIDVNAVTIKVKGPGLLSVVGHNKLDWAMEIRDAKGNVLGGSDGSSPTSVEGTEADLPKAGTYTVVYCNLEGEPTVTADYLFTYR